MLEKKKDKVISVRINAEDYEYLNAVAFMAGMSVSRYIRVLVDGSINASKIAVQGGKISLEDIKAVRDNKL